jgi:hypothetical protein
MRKTSSLMWWTPVQITPSGDGQEGRAAGKHHLALGVLIGLLGGALGFARRVAQRKNYGFCVERAHVLDRNKFFLSL